MAINEVRTSHYILIDIDLWPDSFLYDHLMLIVKNSNSKFLFYNSHNAVVVPAFEGFVFF